MRDALKQLVADGLKKQLVQQLLDNVGDFMGRVPMATGALRASMHLWGFQAFTLCSLKLFLSGRPNTPDQ